MREVWNLRGQRFNVDAPPHQEMQDLGTLVKTRAGKDRIRQIEKRTHRNAAREENQTDVWEQEAPWSTLVLVGSTTVLVVDVNHHSGCGF